MSNGQDEKTRVGWREWVSFPSLGIPAIKAKLDTGARSSALHAFAIEPYESGGQLRVRFGIHPLQKRDDIEIFCRADIIDQRHVTDTGGNRELRYFIRSALCLGTEEWEIEISLTDRASMRFRMLLGRTAMKNRVIVDPEVSYLTGRGVMRAFLRKLKKRRNE
jgi:hypothetical protein